MLSGSSFHSFLLLGKNEFLYISPGALGLISEACDLVLYLCGGIRNCAGIVIAFLPFSDSENISKRRHIYCMILLLVEIVVANCSKQMVHQNTSIVEEVCKVAC